MTWSSSGSAGISQRPWDSPAGNVAVKAWLTSLSLQYVGTVASMERVADHWSSLQAGEGASLSGAVEQRRHEFSTGRYLCRRLMSSMGLGNDQRIPVGANRAPVWPPGVVGSISHTRDLCIAMLAPSDRYDGVGVDLEEMSRVSDEVWTYVATEPERDLLGAAALGRRELTTALFSTKEAVFKAVHPLSDEFLEFGHVTIAFDWSAGTFTACCGAHPKSERYARHGRGLFKVASDHVFAAFVIPAHRLPG